MRFYVGKLEVVEGTCTHSPAVRFCTQLRPADYLEWLASSWHGRSKKSECGEWHEFENGARVRATNYVEVPEDIYYTLTIITEM